MRTTKAVRKAEKPLTATPRRQCGPRSVEVVLHHARPGHGEAGEHTDGVERHQTVDLGPGGQQQGDGHDGQHDDAVGEGQSVAPPGQLPGQEASRPATKLARKGNPLKLVLPPV